MQSKILFYLKNDHKKIQKQTKVILKKIKNKHYSQILRERSFGLQIAEDYSLQLRRSIRDQSLNLEQARCQNRRYSLPNQKQSSHKYDQFKELQSRMNPRSKSLQLFNNNPRFKGQEANSYLKRLSQKYQSKKLMTDKQEKNIPVRQVSNQGQYPHKIYNQDQQQIQQKLLIQHTYHQEEKKRLGQEQSIQRPQGIKLDIPKQNPIFLPFLFAYIKQQQYLLEMNKASKIIRNLIVQIIVLALQRRKSGNLYDALDILLKTDLYKDINEEMKLLKSVWLMMISKIFDQIKTNLKTEKQVNRWKKRQSSLKSFKSNRRQTTIIIRSLSSRRSFVQKCFIKLRQSNLILQTNYLTELKKHLIPNDNPFDNCIILKINSKFIVDFPYPKRYFSDQQLNNYSIIVIKKDPETNLFPLVYPSMLESSIPYAQYKQKISKINSYLIPSTRCFNYQRSLYQNYQHIFLIIVFITIITILIIGFHHLNHTDYYTLTILLGMLPIFLLSYTIIAPSQSNQYDYHSQIHENLQKMLNQFIQQYTDDNRFQHVKIAINENLDVIIINTPFFFDLEEDSNHSSQDLHQYQNGGKPTQRLKNDKKISIKIDLTSSDYLNDLFQQKDGIKEKQENEQHENEQQNKYVKSWLGFDFQYEQSEQKEEKGAPDDNIQSLKHQRKPHIVNNDILYFQQTKNVIHLDPTIHSVHQKNAENKQFNGQTEKVEIS